MRRAAVALRALGVAAVLAASAACSKSGGPTDGSSSCLFSASPTSFSVASAGATVQASVVASASTCRWTTTSSSSFITAAPAIGTGSAAVQLAVAQNTGGDRMGTATVAGQTITISQTGAPPCTFTVSPATISTGSAAGFLPASVIASAATCVWTATSNASFITVDPASATGSGIVVLNYAQNSGADRTGTATVGGQTVTINQTGPTESLTLRLDGNSAFTISSPEFPLLSNTCVYVPTPSGQITQCLLLVTHTTYHFVSNVPLTTTTGCDLVSTDKRTCTVTVTGSRTVHLAAS